MKPVSFRTKLAQTSIFSRNTRTTERITARVSTVSTALNPVECQDRKNLRPLVPYRARFTVQMSRGTENERRRTSRCTNSWGPSPPTDRHTAAGRAHRRRRRRLWGRRLGPWRDPRPSPAFAARIASHEVYLGENATEMENTFRIPNLAAR